MNQRLSQGPRLAQVRHTSIRLRGSVARPRPSLMGSAQKDLTTAPLNTAELEKLPPSELVKLLGQVVAERDAAHAKTNAVKEKLEDVQSNRYLVDPPRVQERVSMVEWEDRIKAVMAKWTPRTGKDDWTGHLSHNGYINTRRMLLYSTISQRFAFCPIQAYGLPSFKCLSEVISSALLLYRLCCIFRSTCIDVDGWEGYKYVWSAELVHKATGEAMGFSEWKGAALVRVSDYNAPPEFEADMLELLNLLCDPEFSHPYGCVAGSVA